MSFQRGLRHDPCVAIRAVCVVEAMTALVLADTILLNRCCTNPFKLTPFFHFFVEKMHLSVFVDGTLGAGGHEKRLEKHPEIDRYYGWTSEDVEALRIAHETLKEFSSKITFVHGNFRNLTEYVPEKSVSGIFLDLGVSSMQLDQQKRGLAFQSLALWICVWTLPNVSQLKMLSTVFLKKSLAEF